MIKSFLLILTILLFTSLVLAAPTVDVLKPNGNEEIKYDYKIKFSVTKDNEFTAETLDINETINVVGINSNDNENLRVKLISIDVANSRATFQLQRTSGSIIDSNTSQVNKKITFADSNGKTRVYNGLKLLSVSSNQVSIEYEKNPKIDLTATIYVDKDTDLDNGYHEKLVQDLNLSSQSVCVDDDANSLTPNTCEYLWNTEKEEEDYYIFVKVKDSDNTTVTDRSDSSFRVDTKEPFIDNLTPPKGVKVKTLRPTISARIYDNGSGIVRSSIEFKVEQTKYEFDKDSELVHSRNGKFHYITFKPSTDYIDGQTINVEIKVEDDFGNLEVQSWNFTIDLNYKEDTNAPVSDSGLVFWPEYNTAYIKKGLSGGIKINFKNNSKEIQCSEFWAEANYPELEGKFLETFNNLCLNPKESTSVTLLIATNQKTQERDYEVLVNVENNGNKKTRVIIAKINKDDKVDFNTLNHIVAWNKGREFVKVKVTNKTGKNQRFFLDAYSYAQIGPHFEPYKIDLNINQSKIIKLYVSSNKTIKPKRYPIEVTIRTKTLYSKFDTYITFEKIPDKVIELILPGECGTINKKTSKEVPFSIKNLSSKEQTVKIVTISTLITEPKEKFITVDVGDTVNSTFIVNSRMSDLGDKNHNIEVYAVNDSFSVKEETCMQVTPTSKFLIYPDKNAYYLFTENEQLIQVVIENLGDINANVTLKLPEIPNTTYLYEPIQHVDPYTIKKVPVIVRTTKESPVGPHLLRVQVLFPGGFTEHHALIHITGVDLIEYKSYPQIINIESGATEKLQIKLTNTTKRVAKDLVLKIEGLPKELTQKSVSSIYLFPSETDTFEIELSSNEITEEKTIKAILVLISSEHESKIPIIINLKPSALASVQNKIRGVSISPPLGLAVLGSPFGTTIIVGAVLLLLLLFFTRKEKKVN